MNCPESEIHVIHGDIFTDRQRSCGKVTFSQVFVCPQGVDISGPMSLLGRGWVGLVSGVFWGGYAWYQVSSGVDMPGTRSLLGVGMSRDGTPPATPTLNEPEETDWKCSQTTETDGYKNGYIFTSSSFRSNAASIPELGPTS